MKLQFKHQKFQADAAKAVVDVFAGQPKLDSHYLIDKGDDKQGSLKDMDFTGWRNERIVPQLTDDIVLDRIKRIQRNNGIEPSSELKGKYNLTIEMETGVGKTYTYIKTMYELRQHYGWSKYIIVVPSVAIREGVYKTFQVTQDHFAQEYGEKIRFFIYDSSRLTDIDRFASDNSLQVMIINSQAFNATGKDARRIYMKLDEFRSRRPIDILAKTNPIVIIDEPQSVEGAKTKERMKEFNPLITLRYSATHKSDSIYNMIYRLDAMEAYNKRLVKKISVKGIAESGTTATEGFVYLESINLSGAAPTATIQFDYKGASGIRKKSAKVDIGYNLYDKSNYLEEYKNNYIVKAIDGRPEGNYIEFLNGIKIYAGDIVGKISEDQVRRIQIRETILSHIERERKLFKNGIKVLSLFFIDEVAKYKKYDDAGQPYNGEYADIFEEEYNDIVNHLQIGLGEQDYIDYLEQIDAKDTHAGYFSVDKKGKMTDSVLKKKETSSVDVDAYDLIMKNKELLLDRNPKKSPVRFIFSHSALREGWDNTNVFQICTLKQSSSLVRKRQEVGRGLRLCVNQNGERMDINVLGNEVHDVNVLTVIASESYNSFAKGLQEELADAVANRPTKVDKDLFVGRVLVDANGNQEAVDSNLAGSINFDMIFNGYVDRQGVLTDKYYKDKNNGAIKFSDDLDTFRDSIIEILDSVYNPAAMKPENARDKNVEVKVDDQKLHSKEFQALWKKINHKTVYLVKFDTDELVKNSINVLDNKLRINPIFFTIEQGSMETIKSKEALLTGDAFIKESSDTSKYKHQVVANSSVKYDLIGKLVEETGLTRKAIVQILKGIHETTFNKFKDNPEEFILKASTLINEQKATAIIQHITYDIMNQEYSTDIFTDPTIKGRLNYNMRKATRSLFDHVVYDSANERDFSQELDANVNVAVYVKLPDTFYINTPVGHYNPDWAIAFYENTVKHIYFVAETKGSMSSLQLRDIEKFKIHCAREHFKAISNNNVVYDVVDSYSALLSKVMQ
ncbi:type III restriction-modification system endonuclease [Phascolarctobacterium sp.]|uniref:type III restriction-modification system endonuclease n=1 Tax=Phascolarctobacterium sp. TaxID=2049039 RepID=UPI00386B8C88